MKTKFKKRELLLLLIFGLLIIFLTSFFVIENIINFKPKEFKEGSKVTFHIIFQNYTSLFYFTNQSNLFLGIAMVLLSFKPNCKHRKQLFFGTTVLISITFIIYWALISWNSNWSDWLGSIRSITTHCIHPIIGFIFLWFYKKEIELNKKVFTYTSIYVLVYFFFSFILFFNIYKEWFGKKQGVIIYSFLDFIEPLFYKKGNIYLVVFLDLLIFVIGLWYLLVYRDFENQFIKLNIVKKNF
ncbi:hypothetical protein NWE60_00010 [Mycoplasmopsis felis]|nr:hypothetical protein [Mycoplasmopsis felis]WAM01088.1 hypothetical protein NWE60_00010 [Mycoplasmopsis felis]